MRIIKVRVLPRRAVGGYDHDLRGRADPELDTAQPAFNFVLLLPFSRLPYHQIQSPLAEEELMGNPVDFLTTEIPQPDCHISGCIRMRQ